MKTLKLVTLGVMLFIAGTVQAQITLSINLGSPPQWGPAGYSEARYYYLPDVEAYYDVQSSMFIYYGIGGWVRRNSLPARYKNYDLYSGYKVVMTDYRGNTPYSQFNEHRRKYARGYHDQSQRSIGERPVSRSNYSNQPAKSHSYKRTEQRDNKDMKRGNDRNMKKEQDRGGGSERKNR
jgi:hypothetical protein